MEKNYQKKIQKKLKIKYISKLLIFESALLSLTLPLFLIDHSKQSVKMTRDIDDNQASVTTRIEEPSDFEKIIVRSIYVSTLGILALVIYNYDLTKNETKGKQKQLLMSLTNSEIKERKCNLNKCLTLAREKKS